MDVNPKKPLKNPYLKANPVSKLFFIWLLPFFQKGFNQTLEIDDVYDTLPEDGSDYLGEKLEQHWNKQLEKSKKNGKPPRISLSLFHMFGKSFMKSAIALFCLEWGLRIAQPFALRELVRSFSDGSEATVPDKCLYALAVVVATLISTLIFHPSFYNVLRIAMKCRIACSSLIYRKTLRLSKANKGHATIGHLINLLSNDVNRFDYNINFLPFLIAGPVQLIICTYCLWLEFGVSSLAGTAAVLSFLPFQCAMLCINFNSTFSTKYRFQIAKRTDERGRIMNEIIVAMRVIKMYAWEKPFAAIINKIRESEVIVITKRGMLRGFFLSLFTSASKVIPYVLFLTYVLAGENITADKVFFAANIFHNIIQTSIYVLPSAISGLGEMYVSLLRLEKYMQIEEKTSSENFSHKTNASELGQAPEVKFTKVCASWTESQKTLKNISATLSGDKVVAIVGPVGSGKTTLLHTILEELSITSGKCEVLGRLSYAAQEPWIFAGNVKQNILFGQPFKKDKYYDAVRVAALEDDLKQFPHGDMTIVGERGVSLSGGQKARINLARALYQQSDIYLLDDPLSAVDSRVSRHLFERCIKSYLKGKLRILVTHQLQYLPMADHIIVMEEGRIAHQGTYNDLLRGGVDFVKLMTTEDEIKKRSSGSISMSSKAAAEIFRRESCKQLAPEEKMSEGDIGPKVYWKYLKLANSMTYFIFLILVFLITQLVISTTEFWLSVWTDAEEKAKKDPENYWGESNYLYVYSALVFTTLVINSFRSVTFFTYCKKICINMHRQMFESVVRAPIKFFDDNPSGRIMNRFTKDLGTNDEMLPIVFFDTLVIFSQMAGVLIIVNITNYYTAPLSFIIIVVMWLGRRYYVATARNVRRLEGITKSPMFTHAAATLQGLTTIRATGVQNRLTMQFDSLQDIHTSTWFAFFSAARCFGVWIEMASVIYLAVVCYSFIIIGNSISSGSVGLAVSSTITLTGWFQFGMRQSAEVESHMTSVERAIEYSNLEQEAALESTPENKPPQDWPKNGEIKFSNVFLSYVDKNVLSNLSFEIRAHEKVGVVGRTGAGKSSLIQALFRMTEPQGDIFIDGINIRKLGLHDLRQKISIIPQDPILFSGSMRYNLDPFDQFEEKKLWEALEQVELKHCIDALDFYVTDGGSNFSVGQRQLVCLARALLRSNKIIVMDEATANVDPATDQLIQNTIREKFSHCTIITIAHRLHSVMDYDRILVLEQGSLKEFDHPFILLQNATGIFTSMVNHTGFNSSQQLRQIAEKSFKNIEK